MDGLFDKYKVILAPMAGVTDPIFRTLCIECGADLTFSEMVSAKGLAYGSTKTHDLLEVAPEERQVGVQIFGHEPEIMAEQAACIEDELEDKLALIDINMGCPARKIVSKGDGSALMKNPALATEIVSACRSRIKTKLTCKIRRGWSEEEGESAPEFAQRLEDAGADAITVHGRYSTQMYRGASCIDTIARVKGAVSIPVVGNGDIKSGLDALNMLKVTGCDAIMVARAARGNPWMFAEIKAALSGDNAHDYKSPTYTERLSMASRHARMLTSVHGGKAADIRSFRKHAMWYVAGLPGATYARGRFNQCVTAQEFIQVFDEMAARYDSASYSKENQLKRSEETEASYAS